MVCFLSENRIMSQPHAWHRTSLILPGGSTLISGVFWGHVHEAESELMAWKGGAEAAHSMPHNAARTAQMAWFRQQAVPILDIHFYLPSPRWEPLSSCFSKDQTNTERFGEHMLPSACHLSCTLHKAPSRLHNTMLRSHFDTQKGCQGKGRNASVQASVAWINVSI